MSWSGGSDLIWTEFHGVILWVWVSVLTRILIWRGVYKSSGSKAVLFLLTSIFPLRILPMGFNARAVLAIQLV